MPLRSFANIKITNRHSLIGRSCAGPQKRRTLGHGLFCLCVNLSLDAPLPWMPRAVAPFAAPLYTPLLPFFTSFTSFFLICLLDKYAYRRFAIHSFCSSVKKNLNRQNHN